MASPFSIPPDVSSMVPRDSSPTSPAKEMCMDVAARRQQAKEIALRTLMFDKMERKRLGIPAPKQAVTVASRRLHLKREALLAKQANDLASKANDSTSPDAKPTCIKQEVKPIATKRASRAKASKANATKIKASKANATKDKSPSPNDVKPEAFTAIDVKPKLEESQAKPFSPAEPKPVITDDISLVKSEPKDYIRDNSKLSEQEVNLQKEIRKNLAHKLYQRRLADQLNDKTSPSSPPPPSKEMSVLGKRRPICSSEVVTIAKKPDTKFQPFKECEMKKILNCKGSNAMIFQQVTNHKLPECMPLQNNGEMSLYVVNGKVFKRANTKPPHSGDPQATSDLESTSSKVLIVIVYLRM